MRMLVLAVLGTLLLSMPGPCSGSLECMGGGAPPTAIGGTGASIPEGTPGGRAVSFNYWEQSSYADFSAGDAMDVTITNGSAGPVALRSVSVYPAPFIGGSITAMSPGPGGFVTAGTSTGGLLRVNIATGELLDCGLAVIGEQCVTALAQGTDGTVWGGTAPGGKLFRVDHENMTISSLGIAVSGETRISALAAAPDGRIWGGTFPNCRVFCIDTAIPSVTVFGQAVGGETAVTALVAVAGGNLWGGTGPTGQLFQLDTSTGAFALKGRISNGASSVNALIMTSRSELWASTSDRSGGQLVLLNISSPPVAEWSIAPAASETSVNCLAEDPQGMLWGGTGGGSLLFRFDAVARAVTRIWNLLPAEHNLTSLCAAPSGAIWGGTQGTPKLVSISADKVPSAPELTLGRPSSGRLFHEDFEILRSGKPAEWSEQAAGGGCWTVMQDPGRGNVYVQQDPTVQNAFSLGGDLNWTDYYLDAIVMISNWAAADPPGNGARLGVRSDAVVNKYVVQALDAQERLEVWKLGASTAKVASYPVDVPHATWTWSRVHILGQTLEAWLNGTRVTPAIGQPTTGNYARGAIALGTVRAAASFDNASVFRDLGVTVNNLSAGQRVLLCDISGAQLAGATVAGTSVSLDLSAQHFPLKAYLNITANDGKTVVYTSGIIPDIWGGDTFTANLLAPSRHYLLDGTYTSAPFDAGYAAPWGNLSWQSTIPPGTALSFGVRTSATLAGLVAASWSPPIYTSGGAVPGGPSRWIQYQARLCTTAEQSTPVLRSVNISYEVLAPNVTLELDLSSPEALPGDSANITIHLNNVGQGLASVISVNCSLPDGLAFVNSSAEKYRSGDVWTFQNLSPGQGIDLSISAMINASLQDGDRLTVAAGVIARDTHGNTIPQQTAGAVLDIVAPVMSITLSPELPYVMPGGLLNITATGHNAGHSIPYYTTLDLSTPYSGQLVNWSGPFYSADGIRFVVNDQTDNGNFNATFSFRIAALPPGLELETRATLHYQDALGKQRGPVQASCVVLVENGRPDVPQLNLTGSASPGLVAPGSRQNVSFRMENTGTNSSRKLVALLSLSPGLEVAGSTPLALTFNDLRPGSNETFGISPVVALSAEDGRELWVELSLDYTDQSGQPLGHQNLTVRMTVGAPRMSVGKTALDANPAPGDTVSFRLEYQNDGSVPDPEVWVREQPPAGLSIVSSSIPQQGNLSWRFGDVRPGSNSFTVTFRVDDGVAVGANLTNTVTIEGSFGRNGTAVANITISPPQVIDIYPPAVLLFSPGNGRTDVATDADIEVLFSEPMNKSSAESSFSLGPNVRGTFTWDGNRMRFHPGSPLAQGTHYNIKVAATATDVAGNPLGTAVSSSFVTRGMAPDLTAAAFTLAMILMAVVVGETIYLVNQRRKWAGGKGPAAAPSGPAAPQASGEEPAAPISAETVPVAAAPAEAPASETAVAYQQKAGMGIPSASMETAMGPAPVWEPEEREERTQPVVEPVRPPPNEMAGGPRSMPRGKSLMPPPSPPKAGATAKPKEDDLDDILQRAMEALK